MPKQTVKSAVISRMKVQQKRPTGNAPRGGRPSKDKIPRRPFKGCTPTIHHPPNRQNREGSDERLAMLKWKAMELKIQACSLREISQALQEDFELENMPGLLTIDGWLNEGFRDAVIAYQIDAKKHINTIFIRGENEIKRLLPIALGKCIIARKRVRDGREIEIFSECAVAEMIAASGEIRKLHDQQARVLKICDTNDEASGSVSGHNLTLLVEKTVTNHIHLPGHQPKAPVTLVLESGDSDVDQLDAEAIANLSEPGPL